MKYIVISNIPGHLSESDPDEYDTFEEAKAGLKEHLFESLEALDMGDEDQTLNNQHTSAVHLVDEAREQDILQVGDLNVHLGDWVHCLTVDHDA